MLKQQYDVIVVGGGGSGLAAAVTSAEHGATVLLLEKHPELGGTTGLAVGSFTACGTSMQQAAGITDDSSDQHDEDVAKFATPELEARNNGRLRRFFLGHTAETLDWLTGMGLSFYGPSPEPPNRVARMHNVVPNAKAYIATLQTRLLTLGGAILCNAPVTDLRIDGGRVVGVTATIDAQPVHIDAKRGVVLATGDYANSSKIISRFKGEQFADIEGINPRAVGDGHELAEKAGAALVNMDITYGPELRFVAPPGRPFHQLLPTRGIGLSIMRSLMPLTPRFVMNAMIKRLLVTWQHPEDALLEDGAILVNRRGERFCDERLSPQREIAVAAQPDKVAYVLLDERLADRYSAWPHYISTAPEIAYAYVKDYLRLRPDVAVRGATLRDVADRRGIPVAELERTVSLVNQAAGKDGRNTSASAFSGSCWVLLGPVKAYFTSTCGGAMIDLTLRVLDTNNEPIQGLYAVGQIGLSGMVMWGHGLHIAWALTSGRLAGKVLTGQPI